MRTIEKGVVVNVIGAAENRGTGLTTRLCEVATGTVRPQPSELWHDKPHPQQRSRHARRFAPRRLDFCYSFHYTYIVWHSNVRILKFPVHVRPWIRVRSRTAISEPQSVRVHNVCSCTRACILSSAWRLLLHIPPLVSLL